MGSSSKKHKSEKKRKRSRSTDREKERHRHHKKHKSHKQKQDIEILSSSDSDVEEVGVIQVPTKQSPSTSAVETSVKTSSDPAEGKSHDSLSIEETNALRARLGLKPLQVESVPVADDGNKLKREGADGTDMGEFVHKPADNIAEKQRSEKIRQRLAERKEKREIEEKLKKVKGLGESDSDDDTKEWVKKSREKAKERQQAEKRAKMLEEMDKEFGIGALVEEEKRTVRKELYSARDLRGIKVGHAVNGFEEGKSVILTLKDQGVLEEEPDTLVNVNMIDNERVMVPENGNVCQDTEIKFLPSRYKKNIERKTKKPGFFDDDEDMEVDPFSEKKSNVLSKYDEEIDGEKEDSFALGEEMSEVERARQRLAVKKKLMQRTEVDLSSALRPASDYYTEEEVSAKFRKPGKVKKLRKKPKMLKADDLMPKQEVLWPTEDFGSRKKSRAPNLDIKEEKMDVAKQELDVTLDVDDMPLPSDDLFNVKLDPDDAELELQLALNKARKLKQKEVNVSSVEKIAKEIIESGLGYNLEGPGGSIVLNSTAEFCRTLGDIPTYGLSGNREEEEELLDFEREMKEESKRREEDQRNRGAWSQVEGDEPIPEPVVNDVAILDEEPDVGKGLAGALRLAVSKGYLEKETINRPSASRFAHLQAQNYSIDDKAHGDDDKFGRRDRYMGPTSDFKEKDNYKPNVKLDYIDDDGHLLNAKEAFRYLSHKFHGKGPGKNKVEKRMKKNEQEGLMKQMSSTDTPLRTLTMLQQKQKETQSPFVVLSGKGQTASISKMK